VLGLSSQILNKLLGGNNPTNNGLVYRSAEKKIFLYSIGRLFCGQLFYMNRSILKKENWKNKSEKKPKK